MKMCFFFFLMIDFHFLIPAAISQKFIAIADLAIHTGKPINESNAENETQLLTAEMKIRKFLKKFKALHSFFFFFFFYFFTFFYFFLLFTH